MQLKQAILPVAGLGTRFLPWTKVVPKELLPIGNRPIIALLVDEALSVGIREICFVINRGKEMIPQYFYSDPALEKVLEKRGKLEALRELQKYDEVHFHVVYQEEQLGDGHALLQAADWVTSPAIAVLFGDDLIAGEENGLTQLARAYDAIPGTTASAALLCLENVPQTLVSKYGIVDPDPTGPKGRLKRLRALVEKPASEKAPSTLGIVGKYIIPHSLFAALPRLDGDHHREIRLIDALIAEIPTMPVYGYEVEGKRLDAGTPEGYREAVRVMGEEGLRT